MVTLMRTTLTLDPDVELLLKQEMQRSDSSMKSVVNDALRKSLGTKHKASRLPPFKIKPFALGFNPSLDYDRMNQLVDELECEEFVRKNKDDNS